MFKNVEKQSWTAVSHSAQILFWHVTTNKAGKCPDFLRKISSGFTLKMLNCPLQQRSLTLQRSCFFFFWLVLLAQNTAGSCLCRVKKIQWFHALKCWNTLLNNGLSLNEDLVFPHFTRVVSHVLNNGLSLCSCQKSKIPEDEERF